MGNGIEHGLDVSEKEEKWLKLSVCKEGDTLIMAVEDNGMGMSEEQARAMLTYRSEGYGVRNVNERITLLYGEEYHLRVKPSGEGCRIEIVIPVNKRKTDMNKKLFGNGCNGSSLWCFAFSVEKRTGKEIPQETDTQAKWQEAEHTPYGKYPETITYTLGKISGGNHSNLPAGDTYEDNGYTRYLKKMLNIQQRCNVDWKEISMRSE